MAEWDLDADLLALLQPWYREVLDYQQICGAEAGQFTALADRIRNVGDNFYFQTMNEAAVLKWEQIFDIVADPTTESLDFRRARLLNRMGIKPPFTMPFLYQKLDELIGPGQWMVEMDYASYTLYIECAADNQEWAIEIAYMLGRIKPAHIVYINRPYIADELQLAEEVQLMRRRYNYKLGAWGLGALPFSQEEFAGVIKMASTPSLTNDLLAGVAGFVADDVAAAVLNGTIVVTDLTKEQTGNVLTVSYSVTAAETSAVNSIALQDKEGKILTQATVYVPVTEQIMIKHNITVNEGGDVNG